MAVTMVQVIAAAMLITVGAKEAETTGTAITATTTTTIAARAVARTEAIIKDQEGTKAREATQ